MHEEASYWSAARIDLLKNKAAIGKASKHYNRKDKSALQRRRPGADPSLNLNHLPWAPAGSLGVANLVADYERSCDVRELKTGHGAAPVMNLELIVSPAWIEETGRLHDPENPRNCLLFEAAIAFSEHTFGEKSVLAARLDLDEKGGGVVDVFVMPEAFSVRGGRYLSSRPLLKALQVRYGRESGGSALQDAWSEWVQTNLDARIQRGKPKMGSGSDRLPPQVYAARAELDKEVARLQRNLADLRTGQEALAAGWDALANAEKALADRAAALDAQEARLTAGLKALDHDRQTVLDDRDALESERAKVAERAESAFAHEGVISKKASAMATILSAVCDGAIVALSEGNVSFDRRNGEDRQPVIEALRIAPPQFLTTLGHALRYRKSAKEKARSEAVDEVARLRTAAIEKGYEEGRRLGARNISALVRAAVAAYLRGDIFIEPARRAKFVARGTYRAGLLDLAEAATVLGLTELFAKLEAALKMLADPEEAKAAAAAILMR